LEKVPISSHQIHSFDAQPVWDEFVGGQRTVLVHVGGSVKYGGERPKPFQQNFLLTAYGDFWKVATDVFRYQELK
jgi:NTF2-related export protein 1/2